MKRRAYKDAKDDARDSFGNGGVGRAYLSSLDGEGGAAAVGQVAQELVDAVEAERAAQDRVLEFLGTEHGQRRVAEAAQAQRLLQVGLLSRLAPNPPARQAQTTHSSTGSTNPALSPWWVPSINISPLNEKFPRNQAKRLQVTTTSAKLSGDRR